MATKTLTPEEFVDALLLAEEMDSLLNSEIAGKPFGG